MHPAKASMYFSSGRMMVISPFLVADVHQHAVMQFTCSLDGSPFSVWTERDGWQKTAAVLINSGEPHGVKDFAGWQITACLLPDASTGKLLQQKILNHEPVRYYKTAEIAPILESLQQINNQFLNRDSFFSLSNAIFHHLLGEIPFAPPLDSRIEKALRFIGKNIHQPIQASALATEVHLSEDRFLHLFREQTGTPLRQYVLWQRLMAATQAFVEGRSAKEAAYEAGFSDPAHFSRTFLQMLGGLPSAYASQKSLFHFAFFNEK